jgi:hypothetical protein
VTTEQLQSYAKQLGLSAICVIRSKKFLALLPRLQSEGGLVVESWLKRKLEKQGYTFDSEMDNKSVTKLLCCSMLC